MEKNKILLLGAFLAIVFLGLVFYFFNNYQEELISAFYLYFPLGLASSLCLVIVKCANLESSIGRLYKKIDKPISTRFFGTCRNYLTSGIAYLFILGYFYVVYSDILLGAVFSTGFLLGILGSSFIKRKMKLKSGLSSFPVLDQLDFVLGTVVVYYLVYGEIVPYLFIAILGFLILHPLTNIIAFFLKIKKVWW